MLNNIYGGQFNPFGSLPYGYDPNSQASVINTGGLWRDDNTVWNLADSTGLVQSLPETKYLLNNFNYNPYSPRISTPVNFYDNLLMQQSLLTSSYNSTNNMNDAFGNLFSMMIYLKQIENIGKVKEKNGDGTISARSRDIKDIANDKQVNDETKIQYGSLKDYSKEKFDDLKEKTENHKVTLKHILEDITDIDSGTLSESAKKVIAKTVLGRDLATNEEFDKVEITSADQYQKLLEKVGFSENSSSITKKELTENIEKLKTGEVVEENNAQETELREKFRDLKDLIKGDDPDIGEIEEALIDLTSNKDTSKALFKKMQDKDIDLTQILTALAKNDKDEGVKEFKNVLDNLRVKATEHSLQNDWNKVLENIDSDDKDTMHNSLKPAWYNFFETDAFNERKKTLDEALKSSKALKAEADGM